MPTKNPSAKGQRDVVSPSPNRWIDIMNDNNTDDLDRTAEETLAYDVSDEALEVASGTGTGGPPTLTHTYCFACPLEKG